MNCTLEHNDSSAAGIFGFLYADDNSFEFCSLERAWPVQPDGPQYPVVYEGKIPPGVYTCKRYFSPKFQRYVYEVMNVPNATFIEIHIANNETQLEGCIAIGLERQGNSVIHSGDAFKAFMAAQDGVDEFQLTVK